MHVAYVLVAVIIQGELLDQWENIPSATMKESGSTEAVSYAG